MFKFSLYDLKVYTCYSISSSSALRGYVSCLAMLVEKCPFFHKRVSEIRGALVSALSKIPNYRPLDIMVCGIKLDYPFEFNDDRWPSIVLRCK